ncbi:MAG: putative DNA-binding domain-containing protein [Myxococcota bacterium]
MSGQAPWRGAQRWLFEAVTEGASGASSHLFGTETFSAERGLEVYANAYLVRLVECLSESFPAVARTLGEEAFAELAVAYLRACPPSGPNLGTLGAGFTDHLERTRPEEVGAAGRTLVALARYEWALEVAFDGSGAEGMDGVSLGDLKALSPEAWLGTRLVANPALKLLRLAGAVDEYCHAVRGLEAEAGLPALPAEVPRYVALSRRSFVVRRLVCEAAEFEILGRLSQGAPIGEALMGSGLEVTPDDVQRWFARWMTEGLFVALERC